MSHESAAVFAQVIPILFIAAFVGSHRITQGRAPGKLSGILAIITLLASPTAEIIALHSVATEQDLSKWATWVVFICAYMLCLVMFATALANLNFGNGKNNDAGRDEAESDD